MRQINIKDLVILKKCFEIKRQNNKSFADVELNGYFYSIKPKNILLKPYLTKGLYTTSTTL